MYPHVVVNKKVKPHKNNCEALNLMYPRRESNPGPND